MPSPSSRTPKRTRPSLALERQVHRASGRRVLDRVLEQVREHLADHVAVGRDRRKPVRPPTARWRSPSGRCSLAASTTCLVERSRVAALDGRAGNVPASSRLAASTSLTMRASRSDSLATMARSSLAVIVVEVDVAPPQRHRRAVHGRERRAQLVGDRGDEVALQAARGRAPPSGRGRRRPSRPGTRPPRSRPRARRRRARAEPSPGGGPRTRAPSRDRHERRDRPSQPGSTSPGGRPSTSAAGETRDLGCGRVPEADRSVAVDEEDAVADVGEDPGGALALLEHPGAEVGALEHVPRLAGDQLGEGDRALVEATRCGQRVERERPDRPALARGPGRRARSWRRSRARASS